uniref:Uncharacterized protein n=1 Tax=Panagrolaimus superbus TaxID=310955 RepID=A0A914YBD4_9BILA
MATIIFLSILEFMIIIALALFQDHSNFSNRIALERKFETLHYKLPINICIAIFSFWCFSIIQSCYVLICELKSAKINPNLNIELAPLHEY